MNLRMLFAVCPAALTFAFVGACSSSDPEPSAPAPQGGDSGTDAGTEPADTSTDTPPPPPEDVRAACKTLGAALCKKMDACAPFALKFLYGDMPTCLARNELGCSIPAGSPGRLTTAGDITACATAVPSVSCDDFIAKKLGAACTIAGTRKVGEACGDNSQCESTFCAKPGTTLCGKCAKPTAEGDACTNGACSDGTVCGDKDSKCHKPGTGKAGDSCAQLVDCDAAHGFGCNDLSKSCITLELTAEGGHCGADPMAPSKFGVCPGAGTCSASINGQCTPPAADGKPCDDKGAGCMLPAVCVSGKCTLPGASVCH